MKADQPTSIRLHPDDNVAVALIDIPPAATLGISKIKTHDLIAAGHKVALREIRQEDPILKYGQVIGFASQTIQPGAHVHVHNVYLRDFDRDYAFGADVKDTRLVPGDEQATFDGLVRSDGRVGTRNFIGILATVSCSAGVAQLIAHSFTAEKLARYPHVDGVIALSHGSGCCMAPGSEGLTLLQRTMTGYARHPNFGGVLLIGLGCETNLVENLVAFGGLQPTDRLQTLTIQNTHGTQQTVDQGVKAIEAMLPQVDQVVREPVSAAHITLGMECGGSDAYSGVSANPALGAAADLLVQQGGTAILSETPEIYGAEHLLTRRAASRAVGEKLVQRIHWWEDYTSSHNCTINNNPTPGNKAGGLTTILEKSLGASAKGGSTNLVEVYQYAEPITAKGLVFMDTPGYDVVSITGMIAGGANLIGFTSGRGTVCGFKPVPTIKLASNTPMYRRLKGDMDVNCGQIIDGETTIPEMGQMLFERMLDVASGRETKSEQFGFGENEFVPWHLGAIL